MAKDTKIIFVGNYKGGVGKTTSVLNFAEYFSKYKDKEYKVLVLDLDPQSSLSEILVSKGKGNVRDLDKWKEEETLNYVFDLWITKIEKYNNIELKFNTESLIKKYHGFDFIPSNLFYKNKNNSMGLDSLVLRMKDNIQYLSILKNFVDTIKDEYDYIIIDCPPTNNLITRSAFLMSDYYIIPTVLDGLSTNGVIHYIHEVDETYNRYCKDHEDALFIKHFFGEKPELLGIFYNLIRAQVDYEVEIKNFENAIGENLQKIIFKSRINNFIDIARSTQNGETSATKDDFAKLTEEIIERIEKKN